MPDFYVSLKDGNNVRFRWNGAQLGNCGMEAIIGFNIMMYGKKRSLKEAQASWGELYDNPNEVLPNEELFGILCDHLELVANKLISPLIFMSDRMITYENTNISLKGTSYNQLDTGYLMLAIKEKKYGTLTLSQLVENPNHIGESGIMGAFWTPPHHLHRVIDESSYHFLADDRPPLKGGRFINGAKALKEILGEHG